MWQVTCTYSVWYSKEFCWPEQYCLMLGQISSYRRIHGLLFYLYVVLQAMVLFFLSPYLSKWNISASCGELMHSSGNSRAGSGNRILWYHDVNIKESLSTSSDLVFVVVVINYLFRILSFASCENPQESFQKKYC